MKLIKGNDFKHWDLYTMENEPIISIDLMERASEAFVNRFLEQYFNQEIYVDIICGRGNNGGDGLAIARILRSLFYDVNVYILDYLQEPTSDFIVNLNRLERLGDVPIHHVMDRQPELRKDSVIIDAILGTGINKQVAGLLEDCIHYINSLPNDIVSVDMPSGLPTDGICIGTAIHSTLVITFQLPKLSFFLRENDPFCSKWDVVDIGLLTGFLGTIDNDNYLIDEALIRKIHKARSKHSHKGTYGHALIVAGSEGKIGAAILSTEACLRAGAGLVTTCVPECGREIIHETIPEAMVLSKGYNCFNGIIEDLDNYTIGLGPGLGTHEKTIHSLELLFENVSSPMVVDADGLNILAYRKEFLMNLPKGSILTPHYKEFQRLFGEVSSEMEMINNASEVAQKYGWIIVLKGAFSRIVTSEGAHYINTTGNPGMATAGSGDVLTGIITGLLAQGYNSVEAAVLGVYIHGLAGNLAIKRQSVESLIARDLIRNLGKAFRQIQ